MLLASGCEKSLKKRGALGSQEARSDFYAMVQAGMREDFEARANGATLGVIAAIYQASHARLDHGASAHAAGLGGDVKGRRRKSIVADHASSFAQHHHFGVRGGIAVSNGAIAGPRDDFRLLDQYGAYRHLAGRPRGARFLDCLLHEFQIGVHSRENSTQRAHLTPRSVARLLDNSPTGKHTTAHGRAFGECIAGHFFLPSRLRFFALSSFRTAGPLGALKNPAWKSDEIPSRKAGLFWDRGNR